MNHLHLILKPILVTFFFLFSTNCYLNPIVNNLLDPKVEEDSSSLLGMIAGLANQTNSTTTNTSGRFYLETSMGLVSLQFTDNGTIVNIQLNVSRTSVTVLSIDKANYIVQSLDVYEIGVEPPPSLELLFSMPYEGLYIDSNNFAITIGSGSQFIFSENLETPSDPFLWAAENIVVFPPILLQNNTILNNTVLLTIDNQTILPSTTYTVTLNSGIRSETGKMLKPTTFQFKVGTLIPK
ncbi:hypothetical protein [Leptospira vanthielii]|uniref:SbsA Ig-like domain-containing protein n=1 Tax=Leptospira vanthielii serovar Holland str. Waz Holland = ATCC 700522 TaxID=1218591 RepID=N1W6W7_9LEPT|nr:hypothetical protein [Leptospira vanthielii]EMY68972.1 hypothetical protein LEP1GSC199_2791 [Leptospira vanthielii serovar Holland str. Waz Holland = ATCC 700522]